MNASADHAELNTALMARHDVLADLIGDKPFHYVDIPTHGNVGDLLIMHGTLAFFRKKGLKPKTISPHDAFNPRWIASGDVIVFHGGGNFGDLYPCFQQLRERIVYTHGDNRIIVLPQSLHFSSDEKMEHSARIFRTHGDLHLCVRDRASLQMASQFSDRVYLLPDMAHQLYPLQAHQLDGNGTLRISRVDDEAGDGHDIDGALRVDTLTDWPQFVGERERHIELFRRAYGGFFRRGMGRMTNRLLARMWISYSGRLVEDAARLFARHKTVVTDRLHGHILACLLNRKSIVLDNSYGKNSRYVKAWTQSSELVVLQEKRDSVLQDDVPGIASPSQVAERASMTRQRAEIASATA